jgi:biotin synthase
MKQSIQEIADRLIQGGTLSSDESLQLAQLAGTDLFDLFTAASRIKVHFIGNKVFLCSIINAKSGRCAENCSFCAQSVHHTTDAPVFPLVDEDRMVAGAVEAEKAGSTCYGIVTSGTSISRGAELERIIDAVKRIRQQTNITPSCSLGILDYDVACALKEAGVTTYHHNLETARSFFANVCTTHEYDDDVATVIAAKKAGLKVCCGGIFGLGETPAQRVELAFTLKELDVDSVPLNFLNPIEGTRLAGAKLITPLECLHTIALFRLILPDKKISVCGGRETNLRDLQSWMFFAGASGTMIGNYLTTSGRSAADDWQMLEDLGLSVAECC